MSSNQLRIEDAGNYSCVGSNDAKGVNATSDMKLIVQCKN